MTHCVLRSTSTYDTFSKFFRIRRYTPHSQPPPSKIHPHQQPIPNTYSYLLLSTIHPLVPIPMPSTRAEAANTAVPQANTDIEPAPQAFQAKNSHDTQQHQDQQHQYQQYPAHTAQHTPVAGTPSVPDTATHSLTFSPAANLLQHSK